MAELNWNAEYFETIKGRHGCIRFFTNDTVIGSSLRLYGEWAENELRFFNKFIQPGATVLDIGAFIGTHALAFSEMVGAEGKVVSIEAQPQSFRLLQENISANNRTNVRIVNAVVDGHSGEIHLSQMKLAEHVNFGGLTAYDEDLQESSGGDNAALKIITIDSMALDRCDFIKLEVEGAEASVLQGGRATIKRFRPVIYVECTCFEAGARSLSILMSLGYCVYLHVVAAFNAHNFNETSVNIFGNSRGAGLIAVTPEQKDMMAQLLDPSWQLFELRTLEDLSFGLLQNQQYFDEALRTGSAAKCGGAVVQMADYLRFRDSFEENRRTVGELRRQLQREANARRQTDEQNAQTIEALRRSKEADIAQFIDERTWLLRQLDREARRPWRPFKRYVLYLLLKLLSLTTRPFSERATERFKLSAAKRSPRRFKRLLAQDFQKRRLSFIGGGVAGQTSVLPSNPAPVAGEPAAPLNGDQREWLTYASMASRIAQDRGRRLQEVRPTPVPLISIANEEFAKVAAKLEFQHEDRPLVSIVVPVFNNLRVTLECLLSIQKHTDSRTPFEIIIADDASTDESMAVLSRIPNIVYVRTERNLGFLMNCNGAARHARGEFLLFLNNDVQVTQDWLAALVDVFGKSDRIGAVGPRILYPSGHLQEAGALVNGDCSTQLIGLGDDPDNSRYAFARRVDYCSGACLILRSEVFAQLGGFSEALRPAYCEDLDLCLKLRELGLETWYSPRSVILHHLSKTSDALGNDYKMQCIVTNQQKIAERWQSAIDMMNRVRLFAFYLPQFHPISENDRWWGRGFTEWSNVTRALPMHEGHWQPRLPADLGFYDLRYSETLTEQASLARRYGIEAFCFYYYWFGGKRLLETPLEMMLASGKPDFPFLLCWANENWTRRWDGRESEILISQSHSDEDDAAVIRDLMRYFRDPRYARVNGRPILLVYRVGLFPDFARTAATWRKLCRDEGIGEIYLAMVASFDKAGDQQPPESFGCDAVVQFPPHGARVPTTQPAGLRPDFSGSVYDYEESALSCLRQSRPPAPFFPGVMPSWDNTARRMTEATIFKDASPGAFQAWLEEAMRQTCEHNAGEERIVFINAWNEWAEGAHLEPDRRFGHANLEAVRNALLAHSLKAE